ncbi:protein neprosin-like [Tasmannia lanceolata]|uniref:protein neprosin-like n=1 Tax=Tasmannia lanceolata TaxID=3420 RepID=UPI0040631662
MGFIENIHGRCMALNGMIVIFLLALALVISSDRVGGRRTGLSREEVLELDRQLKLLKKPTIKSIQTEHGQIFDCVHIHKQPAFDHPLLKNHKIRMCPGSLPKGIIDKEASSINMPLEIGLKDGGCPQGTVPIRRIKKQDLIKYKSLQKFRKRYSSKVAASPQIRLVVLTTYIAKYYGTKATLNRWSPKVAGTQYTDTNIWMGDSSGNIQLGWEVNPTLYSDPYPHLHSYWTADGYNKTGCDDVLCPGFVQVSSSIPMGFAFPDVSVYSGAQYDGDFTLFKDPLSKDWWLRFGRNNSDQIIGYWPKALFTSDLADHAQTIQWGGEVFNQATALPWPPMGSGHFPTEGYGKASYIGNIQIIDIGGNYGRPNSDIDASSVQSPNCYNLVGDQNLPLGGYSLLFGGPGGNCPE